MDLNIISRLVQTIQNISDLGFDVSQIISHVSTIEAMEKKQADLQADILKQEERAIQLQKTNNILLNSVDSHRQLLSVYQQLQSHGTWAEKSLIFYLRPLQRYLEKTDSLLQWRSLNSLMMSSTITNMWEVLNQGSKELKEESEQYPTGSSNVEVDVIRF